MASAYLLLGCKPRGYTPNKLLGWSRVYSQPGWYRAAARASRTVIMPNVLTSGALQDLFGQDIEPGATPAATQALAYTLSHVV